MNKHNERSVSPAMSIKPSSPEMPQIEEEAIFEVHNIIEITQKGAWSKLEIGKTLRKILYVIIAIVQTTMKEIVGRKSETKRAAPLTTRK